MDITKGEQILPVFVINNQLPAFDQKNFTTSEICGAAERKCGFNSIEGAQRIGGLWRIYPHSKEARQTLLTQGLVLRGISVTVKARNPFIVNTSAGDPAGDLSTEQPPSTKLIIGNIPLSFSDTEVLQAVKQLDVTIFSRLVSERDRDENGKLTHWKTGRRFVYISVPETPLPSTVPIGPFRANLYHREQKLAERQRAAECKRCLNKGHRAAECTAPIKCRQCLKDGHKAGEAECRMTPAAPVQQNEEDSTFLEKELRPPASQPKPRQTDATSISKKKSTKDTSNKAECERSSRPRTKQQSKLTSFRREGSGSTKRHRSRESGESCSVQVDKQRRLQAQNDVESDEEEDFASCERNVWD